MAGKNTGFLILIITISRQNIGEYAQKNRLLYKKRQIYTPSIDYIEKRVIIIIQLVEQPTCYKLYVTDGVMKNEQEEETCIGEDWEHGYLQER